MNCLDGVLEHLDETTFAIIEARAKPIEELLQGINNVVKNMKDAVEIYKRTGVAPEIKFETWKTSLVFEDELRQLPSKENIRPDENVFTENMRRSRRNPTRQAVENHIKKEKPSLLKVTSTEMPPPTKPALKKIKQKTFCIKEETEESQDSVIIQDVEIPVIDLLESDSEQSEEMPIRQSSRKTKQKRTENIVIKKEKQETVNKTEVKSKLQNKVKVKEEKIKEEPVNKAQDIKMVAVSLVDSIDAEENTTQQGTSKTRHKEIKKRTRIGLLSDDNEQSNEKKLKSDSDTLEDLPPNPINDATFVSKSSTNITPSTMNTTMVLENPKFPNNNKLVEIEPIAKVVTEVSRPNNIKLEGTGAKKKIQPSLESTKTSRTKTRGQAKEQGEEAVAETFNIWTPRKPNLISRLANTTVEKAPHTSQSSSSSRLMTAKFASELKASQAEYREREKKRLEKEKQSRLQQQRDACDKQGQLQKKRVLKMKALEERKPIYMTMKPPFLPTEDCYDSDDEEHPKRLLKDPSWARSRDLNKKMFCLMAAGETIKNTFFSRQVETPDLLEIFEIIEPEKLKRSSSAIWHKPPRYTMMPVLDQHLEEHSDEDEY